jgi:hypothetical protein
LLSIFFLLLILSHACGVSRETMSGLSQNIQIKRESKIYIMSISNSYKDRQNSNHESAIVLVASIRALLTVHGFKSYVGKTLDWKHGIVEAESMQCDYVLKATVTECEKNTDPWSGKPVSYALSIKLYDVSNGDTVGFTTYRIVGPKWPIFQRHPFRFIPEAADHCLSRIFQWPPTIFAD